MNHSKKNKLTNNTSCKCDLGNSGCFFGGSNIIDGSTLTNLKFGQTLHFDPISQEWVIHNSIDEIVDALKYNAASDRFEDMEFALDEKGRPDGLKNKQEMVLTIAGDIADKMNDLIFEEAKKVLEREDWLDKQAMEMLKESMED